MSKGSEFWGNASGKLGQQVLYRAGGEQRARMYVNKIKNPKTIAQMRNRLAMNNVVSAYKAMKNVLSLTFPSRKNNQSPFNAFVQANKNTNPYYIGKYDIEDNAFVPYGMVLSKGSLGLSIRPTLKKMVNTFDKESAPRVGWAIENLLDLTGYTKVVKREEWDSNPNWVLSAQDVYDLFKNHCVVDLPSAFQLTVLSSSYAMENGSSRNDLWQVGYKVMHAQMNGSYERTFGIYDNLRDLRLRLHVASKTEEDSSGNITLTFDYLTIGTEYVTADNILNTCSVALILSYKDGAGVQVSNSAFGAVPRKFEDENVDNPAADFQWGGFYTEQVLEEYKSSQGDILTSNVAVTAPSEVPPTEEGGEDLTD